MHCPLPTVYTVYNWREIVRRRCRAGVRLSVPLRSPPLLDSPATGLPAPLVLQNPSTSAGNYGLCAPRIAGYKGTARTRAGPIQSRTFLSEPRNTDVLPWSACDLRTPQLSVFPSLWLSTAPRPSPLTSTSTVNWRWNSG
ncbi:hypothetical protein T12_16640 [Trichinella patagoniensis]|uniref:Uncharacterized protein n=1 Tax=Trichinella patagoniensis TaxID=990121 RepID=A0A0V1AD14_9BILA|nr:hypothetical protein T12_16640 [Trichinella patagoniensis]